MITVYVRTTKEKKKIKTRETAEVKDFKTAISEAFGAPEEQLCLIYDDKILKVLKTMEPCKLQYRLTCQIPGVRSLLCDINVGSHLKEVSN